jgi:two-component system, cell cycle response regulator
MLAMARRNVNALLRRWRGEAFTIDGRVIEGQSLSASAPDSLRCSGTPEQLLMPADDELLAAKRLGRNRVRAAELAGG